MKMRPTILLVEDEHQQRQALSLMFEAEGYAVISTDNAEAGLEKMKVKAPNLIISDIKLPGMDGFTFFDEVCNTLKYNRVPFLFITAYNDKNAIDRVTKLGAVGYITKPYDLEQLIDVVKQHLPSGKVTV